MFILIGVGHDALRERRVHPAYGYGLVICLILEISAWLGASSGVGQSLAHALAWVGRTFAGLY